MAICLGHLVNLDTDHIRRPAVASCYKRTLRVVQRSVTCLEGLGLIQSQAGNVTLISKP